MKIDRRAWGRALDEAYPAVIAAARDTDVAEQALTLAARVLSETPDSQRLRRKAVRIALGLGPCKALAQLPAPERGAIGLARMGGASVDEIAAELSLTTLEVRRLLRAGLRRLVAEREGTLVLSS